MAKKAVAQKAASPVTRVRADSALMSGLGGRIGTERDEIANMRIRAPRQWTAKDIEDFYEGDWLFRNIIDAVADDAVREWVDIVSSRKGLAQAVINRMQELSAQQHVGAALRYERMYGDGLIALGLSEKGSSDLSRPVDIGKINNLLYLNALAGPDFKEFKTNKDPFSLEYGHIQMYVLKELDGQPEREIHPSRLLHIQTRPKRGQARGIPLISSLFTPLAIFGGGQWSIGQIMRAMVFKIYQSADLATLRSEEEAMAWQAKLDAEWTTGSTALVGKDDNLSFAGLGSSVGGVAPLIEFMWDMMSGAAQMPKSHLLGQPQGTISGAQFDSLNYYARVAALQEKHLRPIIETIIEIIIASSEMKLSGVKTSDWNLVFKPLWKLDAETDAKIRKMVAETDKIYIETGVKSPEEVEAERFGSQAVFDSAKAIEERALQMGISGDELRQIAARVDEARWEAI